ncbi:MAG: ATP-dependent DNA ligase, partial [Nitrososphaeria archaeon]
MKFQVVADVFEKVEGTTKRLEMTDLLVKLMKQTPSKLIDKVAYLTIGELYPSYVGVELGVAEKLAIRAIAAITGLPENNIAAKLKKTGDLGLTVQDLLDKKTQQTLRMRPLTVERTYQTLEKIAHATGSGSQETKIKLLVGLLNDATPREAKYILRIVLGKLRLGVADMTLLDALAIAYGGGKESREAIERAYNLTSDIGYVAKTLAEKGMKEIEKFSVTFGKPIKPQMAERLASLDEILEKLGGKAAADYKYDGLRIQAQISPSRIDLFSRRQENITDQFPDIVKGLRESIKAKEAIVDGESVPIDPNTGDLLPFQVISQRRGRKHEIDRMVEEVPVALCLFDALYIDGEDLTLKPYPERRKRLEKIVRKTETIRLSETVVSNKPQKIEAFFNKA